MRDLLILIVHVTTTVVRLAKPGGLQAVVAESVLAKHQLLIVNRSRRRSPNVPWSHPFIERLIGTIRRECLDRLLFWTVADLERKLLEFTDYYNQHRTHSALKRQTPIETPASKGAELKDYRWEKHCRGLYQTPIAA